MPLRKQLVSIYVLVIAMMALVIVNPFGTNMMTQDAQISAESRTQPS